MKLLSRKLTAFLSSVSVYFLLQTNMLAQNQGSSNNRNYQIQVITLLKSTERQINLLSTRVSQLQDNYAVLALRINKLQKDVNSEKYKRVNIERQLGTLKHQIIRDRETLQNSLDKFADRVSRETSSAINLAVYKVSQNDVSYPGSDLRGEGCYEYTVQQGATLSAVAKAYKVKVSDIRKANNLKGDLIRAGQILYIPKK